MKRGARIMFAIILVMATFGEVRAAEPQKTPAFYTDVHGAGAFIQCMDVMSHIDPKYGEARDKAVIWFLDQMHPFPAGGQTWLQNPSAPEGHPSYHIAITTISAYNGMTMLDLYKSTGEKKYLYPVTANVKWMAASAKKQESDYGDIYLWTSRHSLDGKQQNFRPMLSGHSWGIGSTLDMLASYYLVTKDRRAVPYLQGGARGCYARAEKRGSGDEERIWYVRPAGDVPTGYCRGNAGTTYSLIKIAEAVPGLQITDDHTIEDVVNANLRYLFDQAREDQGGIMWPNMNGTGDQLNLGWGRGISGIGKVAWMGYLMNKRAGNEEMAQVCYETAESTVRGVVSRMGKLSAEEAMTEYVGLDALVDTIGVCSGTIGSSRWLFEFVDATKDTEPKLAAQCDEAARKVAYRLINTAYDVNGTYAWKNHNPKFGKNTVNMAIDHGQTGVVYALGMIGARLQDPHIIDAARRAADFVLNQTVPDGEGLKMKHVVPLGEGAKRLVKPSVVNPLMDPETKKLRIGM